MNDVTTWLAHATREPSDEFLGRMDRRWRDGLEAAAGDPCPWLSQPLHALALSHVDRAVHKRRLRALFVGAGECPHLESGHGFTPTSDLVPHDMYGPETVCARHTGSASPLAEAIRAAKADPNLTAVAVLTEQQFTEVDAFHEHSGAMLRPEIHGAVIPFLYADLDESDDDAFEREGLLRANGYATYTVDASRMGEEPIDLHRDLALLMEDVFDEIAHLKADAAARILSQDPLWPLVVVRAPDTWAPQAYAVERCRDAA